MKSSDRLWRTLIRINKSYASYMDMTIPAWNPHESVKRTYGELKLNDKQIARVRRIKYFFAWVNIGADSACSLRFDKIDLGG